MPTPNEPKIYHIVHVDKLASIAAEGGLWCDAEVAKRDSPGTTIGMNSIKHRRRDVLTLRSHPGLYVGGCVPFYFCPRSVMLYVIHMANHPELAYHGGQDPIVHLEADLHQSVAWANAHKRRWVFTSANAGSSYFEDFCDLAQLNILNWDAIQANTWAGELQEPKQAEFLVEYSFPWELISRIGVQSNAIHERVLRAIRACVHHPRIEVKPDWYY